MNEFPSITESITMSKGEEVAMRIRNAFLATALAVTGVLIVATAVLAGNVSGGGTPTAAPSPPPPSCVTTNGYTISVTSGPSLVPCSDPSGQCTEIEYTVGLVGGKPPDFVGVLEGVGIQYVSEGNGIQWYDPCVGDLVTDLGEHSCHEQTVRFSPQTNSLSVKIGLAGPRSPSPTTVAAKKGLFSLGSCRIIGMGLESGPSQNATYAPAKDEVVGGKCKVHVSTNGKTGQTTVGTSADAVVPGVTCTVDGPFPIGTVQVAVGDEQAAPVEFSEGFSFTLGNGSCTYKQYYPTTGPIYRICSTP